MLILLAGVALACPATDASLDGDVAAATERYLELDLPGFDVASATVLAEASCLGEAASSATAFGVHRTRALRAWVERDAPGMVAAFAAMRAAAPDAVLDERLAPRGSRLREVYDAGRGAPEGRMAPLTGPGWVVDGRPDALLVPLDRATLVQRLGPDGAPRSWYFPTGAVLDALELPTPAVGAARAAIPPVSSAPFLTDAVSSLRDRHPHPSRALAIGSGAAVLVGAASFAVASVSREAYLATGPEDGAREDLYTANIASGVAGFAVSAAAAGLLVGAVVVGRW